MKHYLVLDYETRSIAPLKKTGAHEYATHAWTRILCAAWRIGTRDSLRSAPTKSWSPFLDGAIVPQELVEALADPDVTIVAHNALFEQVITRHVLTRYTIGPKKKEIIKNLPPARWECTAALAAALALPRKLEGAAMALGLVSQKDIIGHKLMLKYCKPRKPTKKNKNIWHNSAAELRRIVEYCVKDVDTEVELFLASPSLTALERKVWELDQKINLRGFKIDRQLVDTILKMVEEETGNLNRETDEMTLGALASTAQRDGVLEFLEREGVRLPNLQAKTVSDAIASGMVAGEAKRILEIRQAISKTSTAKYKAMEMRSRTDGIVRDILLYWGASTGRWGGMGVQPQNFPRGIQGLDAWGAVEVLRTGDLELVRLLYGDPMTLFASCLRAMIVARDGYEFHCADYVAIETHVLFWIARHEEGLRALRARRDLYKEMAADIYGLPLDKIAKESRERFVGKESVLGCGYQMAGPTFRKNCIKKGVEISEDMAKLAVSKYRQKHSPVVKTWSNLERAAIAAVKNKGKRYSINRTTWYVKGRFLYCELPSGRCLAYYGPAVRTVVKWDEEKEALHHWGMNNYTRKWEFAPTYGGKLTENVVQAIARDFMAEAMLRLEEHGFDVVLSVHDELLSEAPKGKFDPTAPIGTHFDGVYSRLMTQNPAWGADCPIRVEGWKGPRYKK